MRYRDELVKNLVAMEAKIQTLRNAVERRYPVEDFLKVLDDVERLRELVADAVDREPVEGYEINEQARRR